MRPVALIVSLCLISVMAGADFELTDPALPNEEAANEPDSPETFDYTVEGAGVKSCAAYTTDSKKNSSMHYIDLNWVKGFVSGVNYVHVETSGDTHLGKDLDLDSLTSWIDDYCQDHPDAALSDASAALVTELTK